MMRRERISLVIWFLLALFFAIESWRMGLGTIRVPGPGFLTFWVSLIVAMLSLLLALQERGRKIVREAAPLFKGKKVTNLFLGFAFLFAYPFLLDKLGFFLCNVLFIACCLKAIAGKTWRITAGVSGGVAVFAYLLFIVWLSLPFPKGKWVAQLFSFGGF